MAFRHNMRDVRLREELAYREPTMTRMLFKIASMCERMEEGRRAPELVLKDQDETDVPKKKKRKREDRQVLAVGKEEASAPPSPRKGQAAAVKTAGPRCPIHESNDQDARD